MTNDIRKHMDMLNEASLKDVAADVSNKAKAALGDKGAAGKEDAKRLSKYLSKSYKKWLGQTGGEPTEETLMKFLVSKIGFTAANARKIFDKSGIQDPTKANESVMEDISRADLDKVFLNAAQFAYEYDLIKDPEEDKERKINKSEYSDGSFGSRGRSSGYGSRRGYQNSDPIGGLRDQVQKNSYQVDKGEMLQQITKSGLSKEHLEDLTDIVANAKKFEDLQSRPDRQELMKQLARIGYAFFKSNK